MKSLRLSILSFLYFSVPVITLAQVSIYPAHLGSVSLAKSILNPALQPISGFTDIVSLNQFYSNQFNQVRNLFLTGNISLRKYDTLNIKQRVGMKAVSEIEGDYISRTKYYVSYFWSSGLFDKVRLSASANIGRASYTYHATLITSTTNSGNWDGDVGLALTGTNFVTGVAVNQIFSSKITPLNLDFILRRFVALYFERKFDLSKSTIAKIYLHSSLLKDLADRHDTGIEILFSKKLLIGVNYYVNTSLTFMAGIDQLSFLNQNFSFLFSYTHPFSKQIKLNVQNYELGIHYYFQSKKFN